MSKHDELRDAYQASLARKQVEGVSEPPNTEAAMATAYKWMKDARGRAALDAIASELERVREARYYIDAALEGYPNDGDILAARAALAERCPVCEGVDQPGLSHNPNAPNCIQRKFLLPVGQEGC